MPRRSRTCVGSSDSWADPHVPKTTNQPTKQPTNQPTNQPTTQPASQPTNQPNNQTTKQTTTRIRFWEWSSVYLVNPKPTGFKWMKIGGKMPIIKVKQPFKTGSLYFKVSISSNLFQIVIFVVQFFVFRRHQQKKPSTILRQPKPPPPTTTILPSRPVAMFGGTSPDPEKGGWSFESSDVFFGGKTIKDGWNNQIFIGNFFMFFSANLRRNVQKSPLILCSFTLCSSLFLLGGGA